MADLASLGLNQSLWVAFHDSIVEEFQHHGDSLRIILRTNFPQPPAESAKRACLQFTRLTCMSIASLSGSEPIEEAISVERLLAAIEDDTLDIMDAAWSPGTHLRLGFEGVFWNDDLGAVLIDVTAEELTVTADGHPSSLEEWLQWGTAGWEKFATKSSAKQGTPEPSSSPD
jgi:hypothetical protein